MIKLLRFSGTCSFATFLATAGEGTLPAVRFVRGFEDGSVACFLGLDGLDDRSRLALNDALQAAHAVEPVTLDHDVEMSPAVLQFSIDNLGAYGRLGR